MHALCTGSPDIMNGKTQIGFSIGPYRIENGLVLAPMAGITDAPFRALCRQQGAGLTVAEMVTADQSLWHTRKSRLRLPHLDEPEPRMIQIAGADPQMLAEAAKANVDLGAQIIDINMGCPAKKVCKKAAGSALMRDPKLVEQILHQVVRAVDVPVTLKMRTGWSPSERNAVEIARMAEQEGIQVLTVHGRTREDKFQGEAEYATLAEVVQAVGIPVIANGDITSARKAEAVLKITQAQGLMLGRAAQGRPWIFSQIEAYLQHQRDLDDPPLIQQQQMIRQHLQGLYATYGDIMGVRIARKHLGWYLKEQGQAHCRHAFNLLDSPEAQQLWVAEQMNLLQRMKHCD